MKHTSIIAAVGLALAVALMAIPAQAGNTRSFVSPTGVDTNPCTLAAPCRNFQAAHDATNAGGEIAVLGTAGYGALTINRAISIVNPGAFEAGIAVSSGLTGIIISALGTDAVSLRGLTIEGGGVGTNGIQFNTGQSLTIENCVVRNHTNNGIVFAPNASSDLIISETFIANNKGGNGIAVIPSGSGKVTSVFNRVQADNNGDGILVSSTSYSGTALNVTLSDSVTAGNSGDGLGISSSGTGFSVMMFHSIAANNAVGLYAFGTNAVLRVGQSVVTGNNLDWSTASGGAVLSYGDNKIDGNANTAGAPPAISNQ